MSNSPSLKDAQHSGDLDPLWWIIRNFRAPIKNFGSLLKPPLQRVVALDEGRFGLITWLRRRWCPLGARPPWIVQDKYEWLWLYAAVEPTTGTGVFLAVFNCGRSMLGALPAPFAPRVGRGSDRSHPGQFGQSSGVSK